MAETTGHSINLATLAEQITGTGAELHAYRKEVCGNGQVPTEKIAELIEAYACIVSLQQVD